jgi:hypothetical protein
MEMSLVRANWPSLEGGFQVEVKDVIDQGIPTGASDAKERLDDPRAAVARY